MKKLEDAKKYKSLLVLDLSNKSLKEVPEEVVKYVNLKELNISNNQLTYLPDFLKELKFLERINISNNPLKELPVSLWKLTNLKELNVSEIRLKNLPKEIGSLRNLESLYVNNCKISSLPESFGYLNELKELQAKGNLLEDLPYTFKYLTKLNKIDFTNNQFKKIVKVLFELDSLEQLNVSENLLKELPNNIHTFKTLTYLDISNNEIKKLPVSFYKLQLKKDHFIFKGNVFSRATQSKIQKMFFPPNLSKGKSLTKRKSIVKTKRLKVKKTKETKVEGKKVGVDKKENINNTFNDHLFFKIIIGFVIVFFILFLATKKDSQESETEKGQKSYMQVVEDLRESFYRVLNKTEEVYVYTNDTINLGLIINANAIFKEDDFVHRYADEERAEIINEFLKDKSYGYTVTLNNRREKIRQMRVYDSIIPKDSVKLFKISAYFEMTSKEREINKKIEKMKMRMYGVKGRKDTIFGVESGIVSFDELKKVKFNNNLRAMFLSTHINLNRDDYYFYFSPYNANVTKQEFEEAITLFNKMFIKKGNPEKSCKLKTLRVKKHYSRLTNN